MELLYHIKPNLVHELLGIHEIGTIPLEQFKEVVATPLWPSVGVKPNTWKS
jgi:hypothetical protein